MLKFEESFVIGDRIKAYDFEPFPGQTQEEYEEQVLANDDAIDVKIEDIDHNSRMIHLKGIRDKDFARAVKYQKFYVRLQAARKERKMS